MRRRRGRGTFGGTSGVWWRRPNRLSTESTSSKDTAETVEEHLDVDLKTTIPTNNSIGGSGSERFTENDDALVFEAPPLLEPMSSYSDSSSSSPEPNDDDELFMGSVSEPMKQTKSLLWNENDDDNSVCSDHDDDDEKSMNDNIGCLDDNNDEDAVEAAPATEKASIPVKTTALKSPNWNQSKRHRKFGGNIKWMGRLRQHDDDEQERAAIIENFTKTQQQKVNEQKVVKPGNKRKRGVQKNLDDMTTPRTLKEIQYYRNRFQQVDQEVKLNIEFIRPERPKRQRRPVKKFNLV